MKFILTVLAIHFAAEMLGKRKKAGKTNMTNERNDKIMHPAEYSLR